MEVRGLKFRLRFFQTPYGQLWLSMLLLILAGWAILSLPGMGGAGKDPLTWLDTLFTSTSAICVTGLVVRSTGHDYSFLGQVVILIMIQIGGLGFMTLSSSVIMHLRQRITLDQYALIRQSLGLPGEERLPRLMLRCLRMVAVIEIIGAILLFPRFSLDIAPGAGYWGRILRAAWLAIFHSVSAFCNSGFSVWDNSIEAYAFDPWVNLVMGALIVLGGIGFFVLADVEAWFRGHRRERERRVSFQSRVVITTTIGLIVVGALLIWVGERMNPETLGNVPWYREWSVPLFQSITARTAGFNTVDMKALSSFSLCVTMLLMFIGGSPGSCAGGVKTTTFSVFATLAIGSLSSDRAPSFRRRSFGEVTIRSAVALVAVAGGIVMAASLFLMLSELPGEALSVSAVSPLELVFEAFSAFGTVGLSTGITPNLSVAGKLCLVILMFLGRVGPLGLVSVSLRSGITPAINYPAEEVQIG